MVDFKNIDLSAAFAKIDLKNPSTWPLALRIFFLSTIFIVVVIVGYVFFTAAQQQLLQSLGFTQEELKRTYLTKFVTASELDALIEEKKSLTSKLNKVEQQLPTEAELYQVLSDITQLGQQHEITFVSFKPGAAVESQSYLALPINLELVGSFEHFGKFSESLARLNRIFTLSNIRITEAPSSGAANKNGNLLKMAATIRTYRYRSSSSSSSNKPVSK